jgi:hypothetical protein
MDIETLLDFEKVLKDFVKEGKRNDLYTNGRRYYYPYKVEVVYKNDEKFSFYLVNENKIKGLFLIQTERQRFGRDTMSAGRYCSGSGDMSDIHAQPNSMSYPKSKCKNQLGRLETCEFISSILSFDTKFKTETGNFIVDKINGIGIEHPVNHLKEESA